MEAFSALLAICAGNSPLTGEFPAQRPVKRSFDVFFDRRLNERLSKQSWGWWFETLSCPLWRHCNEVSVTGGSLFDALLSTASCVILIAGGVSVTDLLVIRHQAIICTSGGVKLSGHLTDNSCGIKLILIHLLWVKCRWKFDSQWVRLEWVYNLSLHQICHNCRHSIASELNSVGRLTH